MTLNLKSETVSEYKNPSFIGKRQQHINSSAETELSFDPANSNEKAGLVILQNESHFYFLARSKKEGNNVIELFKSNEKSTQLLAEKIISNNSKKIGLKIASEGDTYSFYFSEDLNNWKLLKDKVDGKFLSTKEAGGFIGCLYGMYATSNGEKSTNSASFKYLKYSGNDAIYK